MYICWLKIKNPKNSKSKKFKKPKVKKQKKDKKCLIYPNYKPIG